MVDVILLIMVREILFSSLITIIIKIQRFYILLDNDILEMGAQFIHGQVNNPIYKIAIENGLIDDFYKQILYENEKDASKHNGLKVNFHGNNDKKLEKYFLRKKTCKIEC